MKEEQIQRINELYRKSKAEGLTEEEKEEQALLRRQYINDFKRNLKGAIDNIDIKEKDGSITHVKDIPEMKRCKNGR